MSIPALRKPKEVAALKKSKSEPVRAKNTVTTKKDFMILTLKNSSKLVVTDDSFHCVITIGDKYKCVLCNVTMELGNDDKEKHKLTNDHQKSLKVYSFLEDFAENLVRQIDNTSCYCTICNVITSTNFLMRHIKTEEHVFELNRALLRATTYKPIDANNN